MATHPAGQEGGEIEGGELHYPASSRLQNHRSESRVTELKKQLQDKSHQLDQEMALRRLLSRQCDELRQKVQTLELQVSRENARGSLVSSQSEVSEIAILKERNYQLTDTLAQTEQELEDLKLAQARMEANNSARIAAQSAALVERLSSVQHERERALATQLRSALEEREKALRMVHSLENKESTFDHKVKQEEPPEKNLWNLVDGLCAAKDRYELQQGGAALLEQVRSNRELNRQNVQEKIDLLRKEKDIALNKKQCLEEEIVRLQRQLEMMETEYKLVDKTRVKALQAQLQAALSEKEEWQQRAVKFEDTCETLRVLSSLQRSLSKEEDIKRKYDGEIQKLHVEKVSLTDQLEHAFQERNLAMQERNFVIQERNALALQLQQEYERAERFQRLVVVLRKKAMAGGTGQLSPSRTEK